MKKLLVLLFFGALLAFFSCSDECDNENPTVRVINNSTVAADIQIKTSGGNTENMNNIESGTISEKRSFDPGSIEFTIQLKGPTDPIIHNLTVGYCADYDVIIDVDNNVTSTYRTRE